MHPCPSCSAPLDAEGICTSCGALTRGFFRGLDLGTPQLANAVARGLDFYRLLEVSSETDARAIARRYRQLRTLFPDDPSGLAPEPARRLALLELAGRTLTDPQLRRTYDELRASGDTKVTREVLRCSGCGAPFPIAARRCPFCGAQRPVAAAAPAAPPADSGPPSTEPVDYYTMFGLIPQHLLPVMPQSLNPIANPMTPPAALMLSAIFRAADATWGSGLLSQQSGPPSPEDVDAAALARERELLLATGYSQAERAERVAEVEIGRRILRSEHLRGLYDAILVRFRTGQFDVRQLDALRQIQDQVRAAIAEERGDQVSPAEAAVLLKQGLGYLEAHLPRQAVAPLRRAVVAQPRSAEAHAAFLCAILLSDDPLSLGGHALREMQRSLEALAALGAAGGHSPGLAALCEGLLARDNGDPRAAELSLQHAISLDSQLSPAWRGLAALALGRGATEEALGYCRRALAIDARDERALLMATAACLRVGRHDHARATAEQIAALRGAGWTTEAVLHELSG